MFGVPATGCAADNPRSVGADVLGFPALSRTQVPKGRYWAQPVLHRYDTYKLSNSRRVKLPAPRGAGQNWRLGPGNLVGTRRQVDFDPAGRTTIQLALNQLNPPVAKPKDTEFASPNWSM